MTVLLDTSVLVDHLRGYSPATEALHALVRSGRPRVASVLTRTEVLRGLPDRQANAWNALASIMTWLPVDTHVADRAGELAARYRRGHATVDLADYLIAATAERAAADLWTRNVRHFPVFPDLRPPYQ